MADGTEEALHDGINRKLRDPALMNSSSHMIFKVPYPLREINEKAYEPLVISIGPYHHGKKHLKAMEVQKMKSLKSILDHTGENSVERYVRALEEIKEIIRGFYSENLDISGEELVEMMLLDGFFIIELIFPRTNALANINQTNVLRDLLLVENQLPFSVLSKLHSMSMNQPNQATVQGVIDGFDGIVPGLPSQEPAGSQEGMQPPAQSIVRTENLDAKHMLGLLHDHVIRIPGGVPSSAAASSPWWWRSLAQSLLKWVIPCLASASAPEDSASAPEDSASASEDSGFKRREWDFIRSATELNEARVKFQKKEGNLFDIEFQKGVMSIPTLQVDDDTESLFRNFVAYEQCKEGISSTPFTDYITFMDCLINTGKDVGLLYRCGVLDNWLGDHEVVATMFNRLGDSVLIFEGNFFYAKIFIEVNEHCRKRRNRWMANFRHNYVNTPWALISIIAAVILLLLTVLQSVYSVLAYYHQH
ncbi:hypothetical protein SLEP1_g38476 [Rubroshorea leprosula]|nr:hypothetical protein SLEP1_g38476 [Rubroshorea leprosula]